MNKLEKIGNDHVSGAMDITIRCAEYLRERAQRFSGEEPDQFVLHLTTIGDQLKEAQPAMAPVHHAVQSILTPVKKSFKDGLDVQHLKEATDSAAQNFIDKMKLSLKHLAEFGFTLIESGQKIMTYSSSRAVSEILKKAKKEGKTFRVIVPESRPMLEGRILAQDLGSSGIQCTMIIDGAISIFLDAADIVLVGADRVSETYAVNKVGTFALARMAFDMHLPVYCACETSKFLHSDLLPFIQNEMPSEEVWEKSPENVIIKNLYFEKILLDSFTGFITERGILGAEKVRNLISNSPFSED
ncbi:MAG: translation initiation factor eIF-2B [Gemmatimonadota bacterium]|nr:MAG: translation initiation factor eIF-2B [Gemmatimonadota bacterium]